MFSNYANSVYVLFCSFCLLALIGFVVTGWHFNQIPTTSDLNSSSDYDPKHQLKIVLDKTPQGIRWFYTFANQYWFVAILSAILLQISFIAIFISQANGLEGFDFWSSVGSLVGWGILSTIPIVNGIKAILLGANLYPRYLWFGKKQFVTGAKSRFGAFCFIGLGVAIFALIALEILLWFSYTQSVGM